MQHRASSSFDQISRVISFTELTIETETGGERRLLRISSIFHGPPVKLLKRSEYRSWK